MTTDPQTEQAALRDRIAAAIRAAACPGECGKTEEECARERIQPFAWRHGRLAVVEGEPEMFADAALAVLPEPTNRAALEYAQGIARRLAAHAVGFQDVLDDTDRGPWARTVGADITALCTALDELTAPVLPAPVDRAAVLREAADIVDATPYPSGFTAGFDKGARWATTILNHIADELSATPDRCPHGCDTSTCPCLACEADEAQQPAVVSEPDEDPARIDRLRPEFTKHSSVEAIDAQLQRARSQQRRWHLRVEWLISLRQARLEQKTRGEWPQPTPVSEPDGETTP